MERNTRQREALRQVFLDTGRPLSAQEAHALACKQHPGLGIATVYRNIKVFLAEEVLETVELPGEPPRYEVRGKGHHHHFRCRRCRKVFDLEGCIGTLSSLVPKGFRMESHDILLVGRCASCVR